MNKQKEPAFLGDFLVVYDNQGNIDRYKEKANQLKWPPIEGQNNGASSFIQLSSTMATVFRGNVVYQKNRQAFALGVYHFIDGIDADGFNTKQMQAITASTDPDPGTGGKFATVVGEFEADKITIITDPLRKVPLFYFASSTVFIAATDIRLIVGILDERPRVNIKSIYHHLNYAYIPSPLTVYEKFYKLKPGCTLSYSDGKTKENDYYKIDYTEDLELSESDHVSQLREQVVAAVEKYGEQKYPWGSFLSGGTDSSSITGILANKWGGKNVSSYSIGFEEVAFDEMEYAELAANAFEVDGNFKKVSAQDAMNAIAKLVQAYDEPFGNSSAIPTYYCAAMAAAKGARCMIAGDGGDEIYGGNDRYGKDAIFEQFYQLPGAIKAFARFGALFLKPLDFRFINRIKNFIYRGSLANPERFYTDDSFASEFFSQLLSDDFRNEVAKGDSLALIQTVYDRASAKTELNRLMYIDLQMAIADNDLTKVNRAAKLAGVSVLYPYLDNDLIAYTARIPAHFKVNGQQKRYLFKKSMVGILPQEILTKTKQGFGLPVGEWFRKHEDFKALLNDVLLSDKALNRGYFNPDFIANLAKRHQKGAWDYTQELWLLIMLELWHREFADG